MQIKPITPKPKHMNSFLFFGYVPAGKASKSKTKQIELHQTKKLLHSKGSNTMTRPPTEWEKVFSIAIYDKGLISTICK